MFQPEPKDSSNQRTNKRGTSEDDALPADDEQIEEDQPFWGDEAHAAMDKQEEEQAQEDEGQAEASAPGESGGARR